MYVPVAKMATMLVSRGASRLAAVPVAATVAAMAADMSAVPNNHCLTPPTIRQLNISIRTTDTDGMAINPIKPIKLPPIMQSRNSIFCRIRAERRRKVRRVSTCARCGQIRAPATIQRSNWGNTS